MTESELPPVMVPLFHAFMASVFSPAAKKMPWLEITVTVNAVDLEKALKWAHRLESSHD